MCSKPPHHPHLRAWPSQLHVFRRATAAAQAGAGGGAFVSDVAVSFDTQVGGSGCHAPKRRRLVPDLMAASRIRG
ncbi:hypothetical protein EV2_025161 [Malus domestica]